MIPIRCVVCRWTTEHVGEFPDRCPRCGEEGTCYELSDEDVAALVNSGEISYCPVCKVLHLAPIIPFSTL